MLNLHSVAHTRMCRARPRCVPPQSCASRLPAAPRPSVERPVPSLVRTWRTLVDTKEGPQQTELSTLPLPTSRGRKANEGAGYGSGHVGTAVRLFNVTNLTDHRDRCHLTLSAAC